MLRPRSLVRLWRPTRVTRPNISDTCEQCGKTEGGIGRFAAAYRRRELAAGRPDPGMLCGACAGSRTGARIADEIRRTARS